MPNLLFMFISATYGSATNRSRADGDEFDSLTHADGGIDSIAIIHNINQSDTTILCIHHTP